MNPVEALALAFVVVVAAKPLPPPPCETLYGPIMMPVCYEPKLKPKKKKTRSSVNTYALLRVYSVANEHIVVF